MKTLRNWAAVTQVSRATRVLNAVWNRNVICAYTVLYCNGARITRVIETRGHVIIIDISNLPQLARRWLSHFHEIFMITVLPLSSASEAFLSLTKPALAVLLPPPSLSLVALATRLRSALDNPAWHRSAHEQAGALCGYQKEVRNG